MRTLKGFTAEPLLLDALSGEFKTQSDPEKQHTLGRLAVATYQKGEELDTDINSYRYTYAPSWTSIRSEVTCAVTSGPLVLKGLRLASTSGGTFDVRAFLSEDFEPSLALELNGSPLLISEQTLDYCAAARSIVTRRAQKFFDEAI